MNTVSEHRHPMADSVPFADQYAARRGCGRLGWWSPMEAVFCGPLEQAAGGGFKAAKNSFLQPIGHGLKQKTLTDMRRRFGAIEHPPALPKGGGVASSPRSSASSSARFLVPDSDGLRFMPARSFSRADTHIALVGSRSPSFSAPLQARRAALTEN
jgi:hypothetical protein